MGPCFSIKGVVKKSHDNKAQEFQKVNNNDVNNENIVVVAQVNQPEPNNQENQVTSNQLEPNKHDNSVIVIQANQVNQVNQPEPNKQEHHNVNKKEKLEIKSTRKADKDRSSSLKVSDFNILNLRRAGSSRRLTSRYSLSTKLYEKKLNN